VRQNVVLLEAVEQADGALDGVKVLFTGDLRQHDSYVLDRKSGFLKKSNQLSALEFRGTCGRFKHERLRGRHIRGMAMERDFPFFAGNHVVGGQDLQSDQLIEGRFESLHQSREVLGKIENSQVLGGERPSVHNQ
jgi:hypothetical protein